MVLGNKKKKKIENPCDTSSFHERTPMSRVFTLMFPLFKRVPLSFVRFISIFLSVSSFWRRSRANKWSDARANVYNTPHYTTLIIHQQTRLDSYLETVVHFDNPLVIGFDEHVPLGADVRHLFFFEHVGFA